MVYSFTTRRRTCLSVKRKGDHLRTRRRQAENPYLPTVDIGAPQFIRDHPTFDGRGVTIGNVDGNSPDILAPELQKALSIDGTPVPKFFRRRSRARSARRRLSVGQMSNEVEARDGSFEWKAVTYRTPDSRTPDSGKYRLGFFNLSAFGGGLLRTYLPQVTKQNSSLAVLWQEHTSLVWVDTNANQSFADKRRSPISTLLTVRACWARTIQRPRCARPSPLPF